MQQISVTSDTFSILIAILENIKSDRKVTFFVVVMKEKTLLSYQSEGYRLQMVQQCVYTYSNEEGYIIVYKVKKNRRVLDTTRSEYAARRYFAQAVTNNVLQLKIV